MEMNRRQLMKAGSLGALACAWSGESLATASDRAQGYGGPGLYLYPAWGEPTLYRVEDVAGLLEFRAPHSRALLWRQSPALSGDLVGPVALPGPERP